MDQRIAAAQRLRRNLADVLDALDQRVEPSVAETVSLIEVMTTVERKLTPEQVRETTETRARFAVQLSAAELAAMNRRRTEAVAGLSEQERAAMAARRAALLPDDWSPPT